MMGKNWMLSVKYVLMYLPIQFVGLQEMVQLNLRVYCYQASFPYRSNQQQAAVTLKGPGTCSGIC